jgi:hypothetical protein
MENCMTHVFSHIKTRVWKTEKIQKQNEMKRKKNQGWRNETKKFDKWNEKNNRVWRRNETKKKIKSQETKRKRIPFSNPDKNTVKHMFFDSLFYMTSISTKNGLWTWTIRAVL